MNSLPKTNIFQKETLYLGDKPIVDVCYQMNEGKELAIFKDFSKEYRKLIDFFELQPPKIQIQFIYSRVEMDKHWGSKGSWVSAMVDNNNPLLIYIFSPLVFEKLTGHKQKEMPTIIIHEIAHTFVTEINERCFYWVNEGVCEFVINEKYADPIKPENWSWFKKHLTDPETNWPEQADHQGYAISYKLVAYIHARFGKETVLDLLTIKRIPAKNVKVKMSQILGGDFDKFVANFEKTLSILKIS